MGDVGSQIWPGTRRSHVSPVAELKSQLMGFDVNFIYNFSFLCSHYNIIVFLHLVSHSLYSMNVKSPPPRTMRNKGGSRTAWFISNKPKILVLMVTAVFSGYFVYWYNVKWNILTWTTLVFVTCPRCSVRTRNTVKKKKPDHISMAGTYLNKPQTVTLQQ